MFINCIGIVDATDAFINKNWQKTLGLINLGQILNCEVIKGKSNLINVTLADSNKPANGFTLCFWPHS